MLNLTVRPLKPCYVPEFETELLPLGPGGGPLPLPNPTPGGGPPCCDKKARGPLGGSLA